MADVLVCLRCGKRPRADITSADHLPAIFCSVCVAKHQATQEADRMRIAAYASHPKMTWLEYVKWCEVYGYLAGVDFEWARAAYEKWGRHLPKAAHLADCPALDEALIGRMVDCPHVCVDEDVSHAAVMELG